MTIIHLSPARAPSFVRYYWFSSLPYHNLLSNHYCKIQMRTSASLVLSTAVSVSGLAFSNGQLGTAVDTTNSDFTVLSNEGNEAAVDEDSPFSIASDITMNDKCSNVGQGNVPFFLVNTQDPDEVVFLALEHLPGNLELYLTDLPWNGIALEEDLPNEGTIFVSTYVTPIELCTCNIVSVVPVYC